MRPEKRAFAHRNDDVKIGDCMRHRVPVRRRLIEEDDFGLLGKA